MRKSEKRHPTTQLGPSQPQNSFRLKKNRNWLLASISRNKLWADFFYLCRLGLFFFTHTPTHTHTHSSSIAFTHVWLLRGLCNSVMTMVMLRRPLDYQLAYYIHSLRYLYFCFPSTWELGVLVEYSECQKKLFNWIGGLSWVGFLPMETILEQGKM